MHSFFGNGADESHFGVLLFNPWFMGLVSVSEQKHAVAVTAVKSIMAFRVLTMSVHLSTLTAWTMNVNACHGKNIM